MVQYAQNLQVEPDSAFVICEFEFSHSATNDMELFASLMMASFSYADAISTYDALELSTWIILLCSVPAEPWTVHANSLSVSAITFALPPFLTTSI